MTERSHSNQPMARWFWGGFIAILLAGVLIAVFAAIRGGKQWVEARLAEADGMPTAWTEVIRVTLSGGETVYIDRASVPHIQVQTQAWIERRHEQAQGRVLATLDCEIEAIFQKASRHAPAFADWYYSLWGEYARLFYSAVGNLPDHLLQQLDQRVFQPAGTADAIDRLVGSLDARLAGQLRQAVLDLRGMVARLVRAHRVAQDEVNVHVDGQWPLGTQLADQMETHISLKPQDIARQGMATSAGVAISAATVKKLGAVTVAKASTKMASTTSLGALTTAASKLGLKSAAKAGGSLGAGAASGAALCAGTVAGAPLAPGCALVGGAVTGLAAWVLVDKAVLEAEELLNREALEEDLRQALAAQRDELRTALKARYARAIQAAFDQLRHHFDSQVRPRAAAPKKDFVPARAAERD